MCALAAGPWPLRPAPGAAPVPPFWVTFLGARAGGEDREDVLVVFVVVRQAKCAKINY